MKQQQSNSDFSWWEFIIFALGSILILYFMIFGPDQMIQ